MVAQTTLLFALLTLPVVWAQFPAVCNTQDSLSTKTCCPDNCGSRGTCVSIREEVESSWDSANATIVNILHGMPGWPQDVRYQWPLKIFESVCSCDEGWGGYDCSQCDFGYIGNNDGECVKRSSSQLLVRRNFVDLSEQDQLNFIKLLEAAKNQEVKEWAAITSVPDEASDYYKLQNVSTYDMLVFTHLLSIKEKESSSCRAILNSNVTDNFILFAHAAATFLPWHRYFILRFESELRRIGEGLGISDFTLPYWDWTPTSSCLIFTHELFGTPEHNDEVVNVSGTLFENGKWPVVCDLPYREKAEHQVVTKSATECAKVKTLCDIEGDRMANRRLQRGAFTDFTQGLKKLPDYELIAMTLFPDALGGIYGFSDRLEGNVEQCFGGSVKCMAYDLLSANLHKVVHGFVGGQMTNAGTSVNDPVFYLHHANVDRIFECWLQKFNGTPPSYQPVHGGPPGHNLNDFFVPLFPLKRIADTYKESKELGYVYDDLPWSIPSVDYQVGCPSEECDKGGYPPTVLENTTSAYCTRIRRNQKSNR